MSGDSLPARLTIKAVALTLTYFLLWALGPLLFGGDATMPELVAGLPLWFWFSCVLAPGGLVLAAYLLLLRR
ncbi:Protein of unknown function [Ferrimonas sediminum]|uniref:DUF997 family protein n=1 Tax=Ferrimonas sediminum TaxID=718193 RepID=A0A1G8YCC9_9GAMM|nr:DUF997 family protein [Ferrimonas sediminum]SDK00371.1 Protein of unknown function [Ferrimonas sediminum]